MMGKQFYAQVEKSATGFFIFAIIIILLFSGISFTFVIPGLKGFDLFFMVVTLVMYFLVANIFVGLFKERLLLMCMICLTVSSIGMGLRLWLEWGEFSLVEHMNPKVYVGYPMAISLTILGMCSIIRVVSGNKR